MIRLILVFMIVALILRAFIIVGRESGAKEAERKPEKEGWKFKKGVPKEIGEYIEFEEVNSKN